MAYLKSSGGLLLTLQKFSKSVEDIPLRSDQSLLSAVGVLVRPDPSLWRWKSSRDWTWRRLKGFTSSTTERRKKKSLIFTFISQLSQQSETFKMQCDSTTCWSLIHISACKKELMELSVTMNLNAPPAVQKECISFLLYFSLLAS